ncbi:hypothetical protein HAX54_040756, partial [Datura stramonium]|nr:hypothetical protein [Datura stramonium]
VAPSDQSLHFEELQLLDDDIVIQPRLQDEEGMLTPSTPDTPIKILLNLIQKLMTFSQCLRRLLYLSIHLKLILLTVLCLRQ